MKTYACSNCGNRNEIRTRYDGIQCDDCEAEMHALDGIVRGGGQMAIWRDGREVWSGTGFEAVELLSKYWASIEFAREVESDIRAERTISSREYLSQLQLEKDRYIEADRIVRELANSTARGFSVFEVYNTTRDKAVEYSTKYHKP